MRSTGPLSTYNRVIARKVFVEWGNTNDMAKSLLGLFCAGEYEFLKMFVDLSGVKER